MIVLINDVIAEASAVRYQQICTRLVGLISLGKCYFENVTNYLNKLAIGSKPDWKAIETLIFLMEKEILPWSEVSQLIKFYKGSSIDYYGTYLILENFYKWHLSYSENEILILAPDGKIDEHGTFVIVFPNYNIIFDTKNTDFAEMKAFLKKCLESYYKNRNWIVLGPIEQRFWPMVEEVLRCSAMKSWAPVNCAAYYLAKEEAMLLPSHCPDEVYVGPIKEEHVELVNHLWPHRFEGSSDMIRMVVKRNGGIGIFLKENDSLVSWVLISQYNGPGLLQTVESQKRKGYGELAAVTISKVIAEKDRHSFLYILNDNTPSQNLFHKLGYKSVRKVFWCETHRA